MRKIYLFILLFIISYSNAQIVNIPDINFKAKLLAAAPQIDIAYGFSNNSMKIDVNNDGQIQVSEALLVSRLNLTASGIGDLTGIAAFANLTDLNCFNNQLTTLSLTNPNLQYLVCSNNQLTSLQVNSLTNLSVLRCFGNQLTSLDTSNLTNLTQLDCHYNVLDNLDVNHLTNLTVLNCEYAFTTNVPHTLLVNNLTNLTYLICSGARLSSLLVNNLTNLSYLDCSINQITSLNLNNSGNLAHLNCYNNIELTELFIKNGKNETFLDFSNCLDLQYVCADNAQLTTVQSKINEYGYTNCSLNTYCSFVPGGTFYTIQGNSKYDTNSNGCDASDINIPNVKFNLLSGATTGITIADITGTYSIPVQTGSHTITPQLENPAYFTITPTTVTIPFPATTSPHTQNFCVTANGIHNDLEIALLPTNAAVPGFDAAYKIVYRNKGTHMQSGTLNLGFDDSKMDLVAANPIQSSQSANSLSWSYSNLNPFEVREILFSFNLNTPTETPSLNSGDQLDFSATINPVSGDVIPFDNIALLKQAVVNSLDPNDKTCMEGSIVGTNMIGQYVHYMIRFENTGTFPAQNVVVKDIIDTAKFDIATLVPQTGSHLFATRISNTNNVEFIFENINLPFDNANNDGYVAFKIKTRPTLVVGDSFSNTANIYFDYNFPILTNTAVTTVAALASPDFDFASYFTLFPNPAKDMLNIQSSASIAISSVSFYNSLGQVVLTVTEPGNSINVSVLKTGSYYIKVVSDKGTASSKFLKE